MIAKQIQSWLKTKPRATPVSGETGFTLIELMIVLVILGLLVGVVAPAAIGYLAKAKADVARIQMKNFSVGLDLYRLDVGRYPSTQEGLSALVKPPSDPKNWRGPYLNNKDVPSDPWDNAYGYQGPESQNNRYMIISYGADNAEGGDGADADIRVQ